MDAQDPVDAVDVLDLSDKIEYSYEQVRDIDREQRTGGGLVLVLCEEGRDGALFPRVRVYRGKFHDRYLQFIQNPQILRPDQPVLPTLAVTSFH